MKHNKKKVELDMRNIMEKHEEMHSSGYMKWLKDGNKEKVSNDSIKSKSKN